MTAALAAGLALSSCAHVGEGDEPLVLTERVIREVCIPFVVDGIDDVEVGRRLGGWWTRNLPDPFTPPAGPIFRRGSATLQIIDGRSARTPDGALTSRPMRHCLLWLGGSDETALVAAVRTAARSRPDVALVDPVIKDGALRIVGCIPSGDDRIAVVNATVHADGRGGAGVYQTTSGAKAATTCS